MSGKGDPVSISIEEEGPGIGPDVRCHIFEIFFRPQGRQELVEPSRAQSVFLPPRGQRPSWVDSRRQSNQWRSEIRR